MYMKARILISPSVCLVKQSSIKHQIFCRCPVPLKDVQVLRWWKSFDLSYVQFLFKTNKDMQLSVLHRSDWLIMLRKWFTSTFFIYSMSSVYLPPKTGAYPKEFGAEIKYLQLFSCPNQVFAKSLKWCRKWRHVVLLH
jgi:hypothetical protein